MGKEEGHWYRTAIGVLTTIKKLAVEVLVGVCVYAVVEADDDDLWCLAGLQSSWDVGAGTATVWQLAVCFHTGLGRGGSDWGEGQEEEEGGEEQEVHPDWEISVLLFCLPVTMTVSPLPCFFDLSHIL